MNSLAQFLSDLRSLGVFLSVEGERLLCNAPRGVLTPALRQQIAERKPEILQFLGGTAGGSFRPATPTDELPLSRAQQRLWIFALMNPDNPVYNVPITLQLTGEMDHDALEKTLQYLVQRHEALRTSFHERDDTPFAHITLNPPFSVQVLDLHSQTSDADTVRDLILREARIPFHLEQAPLFRATVLRLDERRSLLLLVAHHIVADGWSLGVLASELGASYTAFATGQTPALPPLLVQYRDFVIWEQGAGELLAREQLPYWRKQLSGPLPVLELPTDRSRPALQTFQGRRLALHTDAFLGAGIRELARRTGTTAFILMLTAFKALMHRYTGLDDIVVGSATSNRHKQEFGPLIGFFVNMLVLRTDLSGNPTFLELLERVKQTAHAAYAHQDVSFNMLLEELKPERSVNQSPLVQVAFTMQNVPMEPVSLPGLNVESVPCDPGISRLDLSVEVWPEGESFRCDFEFNIDLFREDTIGRMQAHFIYLLEAFVADPSRPIADLPLLNASEHHRILEEWNSTPTAVPGASSVAAWFRAQALATPANIAIASGATTLTYAELDRASDRVAAALYARGIGPDKVVGLYLGRSHALVIALLAVLKAGGAYLPLDPALPARRLSYILEDSGVATVLTEEALQEQLGLSQERIVLFETISSADFSAQNPLDTGTPHDLAFMIYTSGSTGKPKGTGITQGALLNLLASILDTPGLCESDTLVAVSTISFDIASLEVLGPLLRGARLVLASAEEVLNPEALAALLDSTGATVMQATPATWRMLVESGWMGRPDLRMWCGGEALTPALAEALLARGRELWNMYGPTETTIYSTRHRVRGGEDPILIGKPISGTRVYVLNEHQQPVAAGVPGELYIAGAGLARGYWQQLELTAERFLPDPFAAAGERMYRTGDIARFRDGGALQLLGRTDQQIKLRGYRIELGEIEAALGRHPAVQQAIVLCAGEGSARHLIAYLLEQQSGSTTLEDLRTWLRERLPEHMVPSRFVPIESLPLTPSGKVDRKRLAAEQPAARGEEGGSGLMRPRSEMEARVAKIWSGVLGVESIDVRNNFFDLGGHSLLLVRVHAQLRAEFGAEISIVDLFRYSTVEAIAGRLSQMQQPALAGGAKD